MRYLILFSTILLIAACNIPKPYEVQIQDEFVMGQTIDEVRIATTDKPKYEGEFEGNEYLVFGRMIENTQFAGYYTYDLYYFEKSKLRYWGSFDDFKVHPDTNLRRVGQALLDVVMKKGETK
jgi:hypothetical protein